MLGVQNRPAETPDHPMFAEPASHDRTPLGVDPKTFDLALLIGLCLVAGLGLIVEVLAAELDDDWLYGLFPIISLRYEQNLPAWYLMGLYALAAVAAGLATAVDRREAPARLLWATLVVTLVWLSLDEFSGLGSMLAFALQATIQADIIESAIQHHAAALIAAGTAVAALLAFSIRLSIRIVAQWLALPTLCQLRLTVGSAAISLAPFVKDWSLPQRLWYDLGGEESGEHLVVAALEWLRSSTEIVGASFIFSALVVFLAGRARSLIIVLEPPGGARPVTFGGRLAPDKGHD